MTRAGARCSERGSVTAYVVTVTPLVFLLCGFVVDGGLMLAQRDRAADIAEQAARRVAADIDLTELRQDRLVIRADRCWHNAEQIVHAHGEGVVAGCEVRDLTATVTVDIRYRPLLLGAFGIGPATARGSASATVLAGVSTPWS